MDNMCFIIKNSILNLPTIYNLHYYGYVQQSYINISCGVAGAENSLFVLTACFFSSLEQ